MSTRTAPLRHLAMVKRFIYGDMSFHLDHLPSLQLIPLRALPLLFLLGQLQPFDGRNDLVPQLQQRQHLMNQIRRDHRRLLGVRIVGRGDFNHIHSDEVEAGQAT